MNKSTKCCACGTYEHTIPVLVNGEVAQIDFCIAPLVVALAKIGFKPVASCCGHGKLPPSVLLDDDKEILLLTREQARETVSKYSERAGNETI